LITATGLRDARGPRDGFFTRREFEHSEAAVKRGRPWVAAFVDAAAEDVDAGGFRLLDHGVRAAAQRQALPARAVLGGKFDASKLKAKARNNGSETTFMPKLHFLPLDQATHSLMCLPNSPSPLTGVLLGQRRHTLLVDTSPAGSRNHDSQLLHPGDL
jgi:hypothetical protein